MKRSFSQDRFPCIQALAMHHKRPISILDIEATGFLGKSVPGVVEFACLTVHPDGEVHLREALINPGMPIPWQATKVHGISNRQVDHLEDFSAHAGAVVRMLTGSVVSGFNSRLYDVDVLKANCERYGVPAPTSVTQLDVRDLWMRIARSKSGKLGDVAQFYGVEAGAAHRAMGDVLTTARILEAMLMHHGLELALDERFVPDMPAGLEQVRPARRLAPVGAKAPTAQPKAKPAAVPMTMTAQARAAVLEHVEHSGSISGQAYSVLAKRIGCQPSNIAFQVSDLYASGVLTRQQVEEPQVLARVALVLGDAIERAGGEARLKPIKEALDQMLAEDISYVQLRVALDYRDELARAPAAPVFSFEY